MFDPQVEYAMAQYERAIEELVTLVEVLSALPRCRCADGPEVARCDRERGEVVVDSAGELAEEF